MTVSPLFSWSHSNGRKVKEDLQRHLPLGKQNHHLSLTGQNCEPGCIRECEVLQIRNKGENRDWSGVSSACRNVYLVSFNANPLEQADLPFTSSIKITPYLLF